MPLKEPEHRPFHFSFASHRRLGRLLLAFSSLILAGGSAQAQKIFDPNSDGIWQNPQNWNPSGAPTSSDVVGFSTHSVSITTGSSAANAGALFASGSVSGLASITGTGTLTLAGNLTVDGNANTAILVDGSANFGLSISAPLALSNSTSFLVNNAATLTVSGGLDLGGNTLTLEATQSTGSISISGVITGSGGVNVDSPGNVTLSGAKTYAGVTSVLGGTLQVTDLAVETVYGGVASSLGESSNAAANLILNGGTLQYIGSGGTTDRNFTLGTSGATLDASGTGAINFHDGALSVSGTGARTLTLTGSNTGSNTLGGLLGDASDGGQTSVVKTGSGFWNIDGNNDFSGGVAVNDGVLGFGSVNPVGGAQPLGKGGNAITLGVANTSSGTLLYTGATGTLGRDVTALGNGGDTIQNGGSGLLTLAGTLTKNGTVLTLNGGAGGIKVTGQITGGDGSTFNSDLDIVAGVTTLSNADNNYTGPTNIFDGGTLKLSVANVVPTGSVINLGNASDGAVTNTFDLDGNDQTVASVNSISNTGTTNLNTITNSSTGTTTNTLTLSGVDSDSSPSNGTFAGAIDDGATAATAATALAVTGGVQTLSGSSSNYSGGTQVTGGVLLIQNTAGSATGTGALSVGAGATIGGHGTSSGTGFSIQGSGTTTAARANVLVGLTSAGDSNTLQVLTLKGSSGTSLIADANLTFNLNAQLAGGYGGTSNGGGAGGLGVAGSGTELSVGDTAITFGTDVNSVQLTLNIQNDPAIIPLNTPYVLIAGTVASDGTGVNGSQYFNLTLGTQTVLAPGVTESRIEGSNFMLGFTGTTDQAFYGANSYLVLYQNINTGVDDIDVIVVPEPRTWSLTLVMLGGLALLMSWQRRRNELT